MSFGASPIRIRAHDGGIFPGRRCGPIFVLPTAAEEEIADTIRDIKRTITGLLSAVAALALLSGSLLVLLWWRG